MIKMETIALQGERSQSGDLHLFAVDASGSRVEGQQLINWLFAWDSRSFYGTLIEAVESPQGAFVRLTPYTAMHFFADPHPALHVELLWSETLLELQQAARFCLEALSEGWYVPSFEAWKNGSQGWKIQLPAGEAEDERLARANEWFTAVMADLLLQEPDAAAAFEELRLTFAQDASHAAQDWLDEEQWLIAIGWKRDEVPFCTVIQLCEPNDGQEQWLLQVNLQDLDRPEVMIETDAEGRPRNGSLLSAWQPFVRSRLDRERTKLTQLVSWLDMSGMSEAGQWELDHQQAWKFLTDESLKLMQAGSSVWLPAWWEEMKARKPRIKAKVKSNPGAGPSRLGLQQLVEFDWKLALGDVELSEVEFARLVSEQRRLVKIRGQWVQVDRELIRHVMQYVSRTKQKKGLPLRDVLEQYWMGQEKEQLSRSQAGGRTASEEQAADHPPALQIEVELNEHLQALVDQLQAVEKLPLVQMPATLNASLRGYQELGVSWLLLMRKYGLGCCLADDMGLGKTLQFIAYLVCLREEASGGTALLICPTSVLGNWEKELQRFAPGLQVHVHYGPQRAKGDAFVEQAKKADLVISSYALAQLDLEELRQLNWDAICLDEAQTIKNVHTKQRMAICQLEGSHRIALTGTPIENRLTELWSIYDFLNPGYLGNLSSFVRTYVNPIERQGDPQMIEKLQKLVRPFLLRRVKKDPAIQLDLPEKFERKVFVSLSAEQGALYEHVVQDLFDHLDSVSPMEKKGRILASLTKLKQICDHPALFLKEAGSPTPTDRSHKLERLLDVVEEVRDMGESCLIFTQYVEMGHLLQQVLEHRLGESVLYLHGGVQKRKRDQIVERFQKPVDPSIQQPGVLILSLKAGGTGLNLTRATHVFHFDRWWNPAVEDQATDRAFRIGQTRDVQVHKFVTLGTLEERIDEMMEDKQSLSRQIVGSNEPWITEMSTQELRDLFTLRTEWVGK